MKKIYEKVYRKIKVSFVAKIITVFYYFMILIRYQIGKLKKSTPSIIDKEEAVASISKIYQIPDVSGEICEQYLNTNICYDLSIVIPAYNVEKYIEECLDSIILQDTKYKVEVIVINDGSVDKTATILEKYAKIDNVVIIEQENRGIAAARNRGIEVAKGEYIMFVDSDDRLAEEAIESILDCAKKLSADIAQGGYIRFSTDNKYNQKFETSYQKNIKETQSFSLYQGYPWGKIFRRELWKKVRYPQGFWFEDTIIKLILYGVADTIAICDKVIYEYRANDSGISVFAKKREKSLDAFFVVDKILNSANVNHIQLECQNAFYEWFFKEQITGLLWNRIQFMDDGVKESIFVLIVEMIKRNGIEYKGNDKQTRAIYESIIKKEYVSWKNCAKYMSYQV